MGQHVMYGSEEAKYKKFKEIYENWTINAVMKRIGITKAKYKVYFDKAVMENLKENEKRPVFKVHAKEPFSQNEEDYGTKSRWGFKIQNSPVTKKEATELEVAIKAYKAQLNP